MTLEDLRQLFITNYKRDYTTSAIKRFVAGNFTPGDDAAAEQILRLGGNLKTPAHLRAVLFSEFAWSPIEVRELRQHVHKGRGGYADLFDRLGITDKYWRVRLSSRLSYWCSGGGLLTVAA